MRAVAGVLAAMLAGALIWRSCASNDGQIPQPGPAQVQDAPSTKPITTAPSLPGEPSQTNDPAPNLPGKTSKVAVNDGPRAPGETEREYHARMEVVTGLEAFRQQAGIGDERYRQILMAIHDHQYNWARFQDVHPHGDGLALDAHQEMVGDMSWSLQQRITIPMTIEERLIWHETCRSCLLKIMFGSDMVRLDEPSLRPEGDP